MMSIKNSKKNHTNTRTKKASEDHFKLEECFQDQTIRDTKFSHAER